jgi:hypothetical protein
MSTVEGLPFEIVKDETDWMFDRVTVQAKQLKGKAQKPASMTCEEFFGSVAFGHHPIEGVMSNAVTVAVLSHALEHDLLPERWRDLARGLVLYYRDADGSLLIKYQNDHSENLYGRPAKGAEPAFCSGYITTVI